ncbi:ATP-binding protein [Streptomyces puniciscabiei]
MAHSPEEDYAPFEGASPQLAERMANVARGVLAVLAPEGGAEADAVLLVASELVSNAVRHGGGVTGFGMWAGEGTVTATVEDASRMPPQLRSADAARPGGLGWPSIQELALEVQVSVRPRGKAASAVLPLCPPGYGLAT